MKAGLAAVAFVMFIPGMASPGDTANRDSLNIEVTPRTCVAPCSVRLAVQVPADAANRMVTIVADSLEFYRSSTRQLDGASGPRYHEMVLEQLPAGEYEIRVVVDRSVGAKAQRLMLFHVHGDEASMERSRS